MRLARRFRRTAFSLTTLAIAVLLAGCADQQPTAPTTAGLAQAQVGSVIKSSVVATTIVCLPSDKCKTTTRTTEVREKVAGSDRALRAGLRTTAETNSALRLLPVSRSALSNIHVSGRTLSFDAAKRGNVWHLEVTHDSVAKGKVSAIRLSLNGKPLVASNAQWKEVAGAWYREHSDITLYSAGHVAVRQEMVSTPTAVLGPDPTDVSPVTLTLRSVYAPDEYDPNGSGEACPEMMMGVCTFMQSNNPLPALEAVWQGLEGAATSIANFFNSLWAGDASDVAMELAQTTAALIEASVNPSLLNIAQAIATAAEGVITNQILEDIGVQIADWLEQYPIIP